MIFLVLDSFGKRKAQVELFSEDKESFLEFWRLGLLHMVSKLIEHVKRNEDRSCKSKETLSDECPKCEHTTS